MNYITAKTLKMTLKWPSSSSAFLSLKVQKSKPLKHINHELSWFLMISLEPRARSLNIFSQCNSQNNCFFRITIENQFGLNLGNIRKEGEKKFLFKDYWGFLDKKFWRSKFVFVTFQSTSFSLSILFPRLARNFFPFKPLWKKIKAEREVYGNFSTNFRRRQRSQKR